MNIDEDKIVTCADCGCVLNSEELLDDSGLCVDCWGHGELPYEDDYDREYYDYYDDDYPDEEFLNDE